MPLNLILVSPCCQRVLASDVSIDDDGYHFPCGCIEGWDGIEYFCEDAERRSAVTAEWVAG